MNLLSWLKPDYPFPFIPGINPGAIKEYRIILDLCIAAIKGQGFSIKLPLALASGHRVKKDSGFSHKGSFNLAKAGLPFSFYPRDKSRGN